jgi:hypothetical protein
MPQRATSKKAPTVALLTCGWLDAPLSLDKAARGLIILRYVMPFKMKVNPLK